MRQREGLIARVRQIRIAAADAHPQSGAAGEPAPVTVDSLEQRISHLEQQLRGLQDSVHRENVRHTGQLADLAARTEPAALAVAIEKNARERGL